MSGGQHIEGAGGAYSNPQKNDAENQPLGQLQQAPLGAEELGAEGQVEDWMLSAPPELAALTTPQDRSHPSDQETASPSHTSQSIQQTLKAAVASPILWWGAGNCFATCGVSLFGFLANAALTPFYLWRDLRSSSVQSPESPPEVEQGHGNTGLRAWVKSPGFFAVVDGAVVGAAAAEAIGYSLASDPASATEPLLRGIAFVSYMVGAIGAVADINREYWRKLGVAEPLGERVGKLFRVLPKSLQGAVLCAGMWWGAGDCLMGVSGLTTASLLSSPVTSLFLCAGVVVGASAVVRAMRGYEGSEEQASHTRRSTYLRVAISHGLYGLANLFAGKFELVGGFACWTACAILLAKMQGSTQPAPAADSSAEEGQGK